MKHIDTSDFASVFSYLFMPVLYYLYFLIMSKGIKGFMKIAVITEGLRKIPVFYMIASIVICWALAWFICELLDHNQFNLLHTLKVFFLFAIPDIIGIIECQRMFSGMAESDVSDESSRLKNLPDYE
jgi:uncharacterized membrane protein